MTATREAPPPLTPDITVPPINRRPKQMPWPLSIYQTAVGKKWVMALTGIGLMGFVFAHMIGNLKMYLGPEEYDAYAESLRSLLHPIMPDHVVLWLMRIGLIVFFALHLHAAYSLTIMNRRSRGTRKVPGSRRDYLAANWASLTMRWSGVIVLAFIGFHLCNLTWGIVADPGFQQGSTYDNVVHAFKAWGGAVAVIYIVSMIALGFHLFHGAWSLFQSLGVNNPRYNGLRKGFAIGFTAIVCGINITFPIAVLTGIVAIPAT